MAYKNQSNKSLGKTVAWALGHRVIYFKLF